MNKIAKIGLTALAGSLVATSAFAGSMSVSGSAKVSYVGGTGSSAANPASNSKAISFSGSGELDNGMTVSTGYTMTDAAFSSAYVSLDMGDSGTLHFMNGTSKAGIQKYQDMMPTAGEQVWDDTTNLDTNDYGVVGTGNANAFGYEVSTMGLTFSASMGKEAQGTDTSFVVVADELMDGLSVGYGIGSNSVSATQEDDHSTMYATYTAGMATVGVQRSKIDKASADQERTAAAISLAINENMSVSYGVSTVDFETASLSDEESSGVSASYTVGGITIAGVFNNKDAVGGTAGSESEFKEVSVAFAF
jgi:outer membrane protein OmpU